MATWADLVTEAPLLADAGRRLFYQYGAGLAFLATADGDGTLRVHPVNVAVTDDHVYAFIAPGPKRRDLLRDGRYAMHAPLPDTVEEEFMLSGVASVVDSPAEHVSALAAYHLPSAPANHRLFRFEVERALHAVYRARGAWPPDYEVWHAADADGGQ